MSLLKDFAQVARKIAIKAERVLAMHAHKAFMGQEVRQAYAAISATASFEGGEERYTVPAGIDKSAAREAVHQLALEADLKRGSTISATWPKPARRE